MSNISKFIDESLRRPHAGKDALCNVVAEVATEIVNSSNGGGSVVIPFEPRILYSDLTASTEIDSSKTPIAIEVVPASHMEDGKSRWMSLKNMSLTDPENGTTATGDNSENPGAGIMWGYTRLVVNGEYNQLPSILAPVTPGQPSASVGLDSYFTDSPNHTPNSGYLPFYVGSGIGINSPSNYKYISSNGDSLPSPFNADGSANPNYRAIEINGESISNPLSQFNGAELTEGIIAVATATETEGPIENSYEEGHYPAAMCCHRYVTEGTNAGDWYLPAAGELGYAITNTLIINNKLIELSDAGFDVVCIPEFSVRSYNEGLGYCLWSSSEYSSDNAYYIDYYGSVYHFNKGDDDSLQRVRAFLAL